MPSPRSQSSFLIQGDGSPGPFEIVVPSPAGGLMHFQRDNTRAEMPWNGPNFFGEEQPWTSASLIQSSFGLEVVALRDGELAHFWRGPAIWYGPTRFGSGLTGNPAFIQSTFGRNGNFEVVVPRASGGLSHFFRDNDPVITASWSGPTDFGSGNVAGVALIESNYGNLEVIAVEDDRLVFYWRDSAGWQGPYTIDHEGVTGRPAFLQSTLGSRGNFEVVVPRLGGGLAHYWRDNDDPALPWHGPTTFGSGTIREVSCIQSSYGPGNLEVVAREGNRLAFYWRMNGPPWTWSGPYYICEKTVTLHFKFLVDADATYSAIPDEMLAGIRTVFETAGIQVTVGSMETLNLPLLQDVDVNCLGIGPYAAEQVSLFDNNRNFAGPSDVCIYFVSSTSPGWAGCAAYTADHPGAIVTAVGSQWTMAHEVGHVLGLGHVGDQRRLMLDSGTWNVVDAPPDLVPHEVWWMRGSRYLR